MDIPIHFRGKNVISLLVKSNLSTEKDFSFYMIKKSPVTVDNNDKKVFNFLPFDYDMAELLQNFYYFLFASLDTA